VGRPARSLRRPDDDHDPQQLAAGPTVTQVSRSARGALEKRSPLLHFTPYDELEGCPNVIVDGSPTDGTLLCLTHWPGIAGPAEFHADLSAQMAFAYLGAYDRHDTATAVSNNHFDQDGLVSLYALTRPEEALARQELLVDIARAGDFATFHHRQAARISMALSAYATAERSPLADLASDYGAMTAQLYQELLGRLDDLCDHPDRYRPLWAEEDATLKVSEDALATGQVTLDEVDDIDLAVVTLPDVGEWAGGHRFAGRWVSGLHPMALCNATDQFALLTIQAQRYEFTYRYETWVQYRSRRPRPRRDLTALADRLNAEEPLPGHWVGEPASALTPTLALHGAPQSEIDPTRFRSLLEDHLRNGPPAWDPYRTPVSP
jgi:hypothetical protein